MTRLSSYKAKSAFFMSWHGDTEGRGSYIFLTLGLINSEQIWRQAAKTAPTNFPGEHTSLTSQSWTVEWTLFCVYLKLLLSPKFCIPFVLREKPQRIQKMHWDNNFLSCLIKGFAYVWYDICIWFFKSNLQPFWHKTNYEDEYVH